MAQSQSRLAARVTPSIVHTLLSILKSRLSYLRMTYPTLSAKIMRYLGRIALFGLVGFILFGDTGFKRASSFCSHVVFGRIMLEASPLLTLSYSMIVPLYRLFSDLHHGFKKRASWTHIATQILKAAGDMEKRSRVMDEAFLEGIRPPRPWVFISGIYVSSLGLAYISPEIDNRLQEQFARATLALVALYFDPEIGGAVQKYPAALKSMVNSIIDGIAVRLGLKGLPWAYPIVCSLLISPIILAIDYRYPEWKGYLQAIFLIRRSEYKSWKDPELWMSLVLRYTIFGLIYMLYRVRRGFKLARDVRRREEAISVPGIPVFASQYASYGAAKHQVLIVGDSKHELTVSRDGAALAEYKHMNFNIDHEQRKRARDQGVLALKDHYVYLVGWTKQDNQQIAALCKAKIASWVYNVTSRNCQHFIREVADEIIPSDMQAQDWGYFRLRTATAYQRWLIDGWKFRFPFTLTWSAFGIYRTLTRPEVSKNKWTRRGEWFGSFYAQMYILKYIFGRYF
ncbi:hypothetical protein K504DRAFT_454161 [Pleomassaria siparia CBS 279.74]|uniref:Uncharacterized protein n=1 Tax=Pleomassaria siparia CBS 279.74 TaxID=1314801 RepID=A0A6G1KFB4_9PLEO|nr:hypothetical protein K504DRAFT_454161 [Pleomassaria siparia CBS 279.74]